MHIHERSRRLWGLDIARGIFIFTMMGAHAIFFFHQSINPFLQLLGGIGDFISFSGTLLIAGATVYPAYLSLPISAKTHLSHGLKRLFVYVICYYCLSLLIAVSLYGWSLSLPWEIISFQKLVPFTEFILPFIVFGLLKIPLRYVFRWLLQYPLVGLAFGVLSYFLGNVLSSLTTTLPLSWKAIWVWHDGMFSFPLLQYFPVYLLGMYLGKQYATTNQVQFKSLLWQLIKTAFFLSLVIYFAGLSWGALSSELLGRWPPTPLFILFSVAVSLLSILVILKLDNLAKFPWTRAFLLVLGQNAFALFFTHTALLYGYQMLGFPKVYSALLVIVLWLLSILFALGLAKIIPFNYRITLTFINWCECRLGLCVHAREPRWLSVWKHQLLQVASLPRRLSFMIGFHRVQPIRFRNLFAVVGLFIAIATPVGLVENQILLEQQFLTLTGTTNRKWFLTTDTTVSSIYSLALEPYPQKDQITSIELYVDSNYIKDLEKKANNVWAATISPIPLGVGEHVLSAAFNIGSTRYQTQNTPLFVSEPLYITWTADWEGYDVDDQNLSRLAKISADFNVPITHMFNPRIYTDPSFPKARAEALTLWLKSRQSEFGEEVGLHLHMFPDFVKAAGVEPKSEPTWGGGVSPGYDILTTVYTASEMRQMLIYAKKLFSEHNLGEPTSYRAGAWFANIETLTALQDEGFLVDTSGRTAYTFGTKHIAGPWDLSPTDPPYFPSKSNQNKNYPSPTLKILEIPNNGADDYAFSTEKMQERFYFHFTGKPLVSLQQITFLTHPQWLNAARDSANRQLFSLINQYRYDADAGPVIFTNLKHVYEQFASSL